MKATILNGAAAEDGFCQQAASMLERELSAGGWQVEHFRLAAMKLGYCLGCFECWVKTPGLCRIDDAGREVAAAVIGSDLAVYLTPITFGGYSAELKKAVDRLICLISPFFSRIDGEVHHRTRYERYPALLGVGVLAQPHPAQDEIFRTLIGRNAINLHAPAHDTLVLLRGPEEGSGRPELSRVLSERLAALGLTGNGWDRGANTGLAAAPVESAPLMTGRQP